MGKMDITFLIPCLNESATINEVIEKAYKAGKKAGIGKFEVLVADNGSTDGSIEKIKKRKIARLIHVPLRGYGAALHWGILKARGSYVLFADADLSYDFGEVGKFLKFKEKGYDLILGSRFKGKIEKGAMPLLNRYFGTPILTFLIRTMYGIRTTDSNSGMRMIKKSFYAKLGMRNSGMEWASGLLLKTALNNGKYVEVPITLYRDKRTKPPHMLRWIDGWRNLRAIVLLKPNCLSIPLIFFSTLVLIFLPISFNLTFFFLLLSGSLFLSILAAKLLNFAIGGSEDGLINAFEKLPIVMLAIIATLFAFIMLFLIPEEHKGTKLLIASAALIFDMWVFLIETIKTHLINSLPEKI